MKITTAWAIVWIAVSAAVIAGIWITRSSACLWAFLLPAMVRISTGSEKGHDDKRNSTDS